MVFMVIAAVMIIDCQRFNAIQWRELFGCLWWPGCEAPLIGF